MFWLFKGRSWKLKRSLPTSADHQGSGADLPPEERLPGLHGPEGPVLRLVRPGGKVSLFLWESSSTRGFPGGTKDAGDGLMVCPQVHQEAGLQPLVGGKRLVVVARPAVCGDPVLQSAEPQLQEEASGRKIRLE